MFENQKSFFFTNFNSITGLKNHIKSRKVLTSTSNTQIWNTVRTEIRVRKKSITNVKVVLNNPQVIVILTRCSLPIILGKKRFSTRRVFKHKLRCTNYL